MIFKNLCILVFWKKVASACCRALRVPCCRLPPSPPCMGGLGVRQHGTPDALLYADGATCSLPHGDDAHQRRNVVPTSVSLAGLRNWLPNNCHISIQTKYVLGYLCLQSGEWYSYYCIPREKLQHLLANKMTLF